MHLVRFVSVKRLNVIFYNQRECIAPAPKSPRLLWNSEPKAANQALDAARVVGGVDLSPHARRPFGRIDDDRPDRLGPSFGVGRAQHCPETSGGGRRRARVTG